MPADSTTHLVLLPSYNTGPRLTGVVTEVLRAWRPVMVVIDGSDDGSGEKMQALARDEPGLTVLVLPRNSGKGAAVLAGAAAARDRGFTHALAMDADGQHPVAGITEFMEASRRRPDAMILGRPVFGPEVPLARLHGRKLTIALARLATLGRAVDDPLYGFRVYPLAPLLEALGPRRGGRGYDFDTEAAVRLVWAGVEPINLPSPVRYFSREEGGVSHFHYVRDNIVLAAMHARLIGEVLLCRWPALIRHRRRWAKAGRFLGALAFVLAILSSSADAGPPATPMQRIAAGEPAWRELAGRLRSQAAVTADFRESRWFAFKKGPTVLSGEVRVSATHGLSLHYTGSPEQTVVIDRQGMLVRTAAGDAVPPADPRAAAADSALLSGVRLDLDRLAEDFEIFGRRDGEKWRLSLLPRDRSLRRTLGRISIEGDGSAVRRIELRRSASQRVEIVVAPPRSTAGFTPEEIRRFFRAP